MPRHDGYMVHLSPDGKVEADTLRCTHCGGHFVMGKESVKWCGSCSGAVCPKPVCSGPCERAAKHFMREIDRAESRGRFLRDLGVEK